MEALQSALPLIRLTIRCELVSPLRRGSSVYSDTSFVSGAPHTRTNHINALECSLTHFRGLMGVKAKRVLFLSLAASGREVRTGDSVT